MDEPEAYRELIHEFAGSGRAMGGWALVGEPTDDWLAPAEQAKRFTAAA